MKTHEQLKLQIDDARSGRDGTPQTCEQLVEHIINIYGTEIELANAEIGRLQRVNDNLFRIKQKTVIANRDLMFANKRLVDIIDSQPHAKSCHYVLGQDDKQCNCWKARAARAAVAGENAPPTFTVTGRFGASIMFVGYCKWRKQWFWLYGGGTQEEIAEPEALFLDDDYIANNLLKTPRPKRADTSRIRRRKGGEQLALDL